ncbi:eukaryotic translation initiation factor 4E1 [Drosophila sulfurigaster albostrigata]|uniref:eIF-4F 25 kDa subunit n=1 Tax=Drosophila albomicans TaxID=7291 RepID=A0A6P8X348_DROAB|nr:eukaryotic translation initiation factor 4E1 [Drosophila albomicans]XP_062129993.1 eukaryotic translation initiation factor 4E1 [Drosophila sulfurigaster albostrigata]
MASAEIQIPEPSVFEPNKFLQSRLELQAQAQSPQSAHDAKQELQKPRDQELEGANNKSVPEQQNEQTYKIEYKHPLEHVWTLWYLENDRTKHWRDMLNEITQIDSIETFWSLYYTIKTPSELKVNCDYYMFKQGIQPMWEDEANIKGGRWLFTMGKSSKDALDRVWLDILLMMVGESFEYASDICGAVVNIRGKSNKISVWTANHTNELAVLEIGFKLKTLLHLQSHNLQYQLHSDAMSKMNSGVRSVYSL